MIGIPEKIHQSDLKCCLMKFRPVTLTLLHDGWKSSKVSQFW